MNIYKMERFPLQFIGRGSRGILSLKFENGVHLWMFPVSLVISTIQHPFVKRFEASRILPDAPMIHVNCKSC